MKDFELVPEGGRTLPSMAQAAAAMLSGQENLSTRILATTGGEYIIQADCRCGRILRWIGMDQQITVTLSPAGQGRVHVKIVRNHRFLSRSLLFLTGLLVCCWPLAVTAAAGAVRGSLLERRIIRFLSGRSPPDV